MRNKKRIIALIVAFAMVFALAFSVFFIAHNSEHKCSGADCEICAQINNCLVKLNNITPKPQNALIVALAFFGVVLLLGEAETAKIRKSLIQLKVKLSN